MRRYDQFSWSTTIRDKISAAPPRCSPDTRPEREIVYPENNREVMPKLYLVSERTIETDPIYASSGCPKKRGQFETDTIKDMQTSAYLQSYLFRTGDA